MIELLVTLALLAILATIVVPVVQVQMQRQREQELRVALREMRTAIDAYKRAVETGRIPVRAGATGYPPSLEILVEGVADQSDPNRHKMFFLRRLPRDPFGEDMAQPEANGWGKRSYASEAAEPEEGDDVYDVYSRSAGIGLNGVPLRQW